MKKILIFLFLVIQLSVCPGQEIDLNKLDEYFSKAYQDWKVPGMAIAIVQNDTTIFCKGYGVRELGKPEQVTEETLFAIASNTKSFTAAGLAILVDEKKINWDDRVQKYLPYFQLYDPYVSFDIRILDLLCHRVGHRTFSGDLIWYGTSYDREEVIRRAKYLQQVYPFRYGYGYSNIMYIAAGKIIEVVSGKSWEKFIWEKILMPLKMNHTIFSVKEIDNFKNIATPHGEWEDTIITFPWYNWDNAAPAGGIISSADDMAHWLRLIINNGIFEEQTIFSEQQWERMLTPYNSFTVKKMPSGGNQFTHFKGYGLGWRLQDYRGFKVVGHSGAYDGMYSRMAIVPEKKFGCIILTNSMTGIGSAIVYTILDAFLGGEAQDWSRDYFQREHENKIKQLAIQATDDSLRKQNTLPSLPLESYAGIYGGNVYGDASVKLEQNKLVIKLLPNPDFVADLTHWHFDTFEIHWRKRFPWFGTGKVQFILNDKGEVVELKLNIPNQDFWFHELDFKKK